jgi:hypothetical protein
MDRQTEGKITKIEDLSPQEEALATELERGGRKAKLKLSGQIPDANFGDKLRKKLTGQFPGSRNSKPPR